MKGQKIVHLHWGYKDPKLLRGVIEGFSLCCLRMPHEDLTAFKIDATCPRCLAIWEGIEGADPKEGNPS